MRAVYLPDEKRLRSGVSPTRPPPQTKKKLYRNHSTLKLFDSYQGTTICMAVPVNDPDDFQFAFRCVCGRTCRYRFPGNRVLQMVCCYYADHNTSLCTSWATGRIVDLAVALIPPHRRRCNANAVYELSSVRGLCIHHIRWRLI